VAVEKFTPEKCSENLCVGGGFAFVVNERLHGELKRPDDE
jgi:hypothetical protein